MGKRKVSKKGETPAIEETGAACASDVAGTGADSRAFISGFPMDAEEAEAAIHRLFRRASVCPDRADTSRLCHEGAELPEWMMAWENCEADPFIARHKIHELLVTLLTRLQTMAIESPEKEHGEWAGRVLAETQLTLQKRKGRIGSFSPAFQKRSEELSSLSELIQKESGASPVTLWVLRAYDRTLEVKNSADLFNAFIESDPSLANEKSVFGLDHADEWIPEAFAEVLAHPEDERQNPWFEKLIWPWLLSRRSEIECENWALEKIQTHAGIYNDVWKQSFSNLNTDFRKSWATFFNRPTGYIRGLERQPLW